MTGELVGRWISGDKLTDPVVLAKGWVDYHVAHHAAMRNGAFEVIASSVSRDAQRTYVPLSVSVARSKPFRQEAWQGWKTVVLPGYE